MLFVETSAWFTGCTGFVASRAIRSQGVFQNRGAEHHPVLARDRDWFAIPHSAVAGAKLRTFPTVIR